MNALLAFLVILFVDRFSKAWAFQTLADKAFAPFYGCNIVLTWNKGISWGMFASDSEMAFYVLTGVISVTIAGLLYYTVRRALRFQPIIFETVALVGALSNLVDRFFYGAVIDFIQLYVGPFSFPVFNIADVAICIGAAGMLWHSSQKEQHGCYKQRD